jgi:hypothetical protein
MLTQIEKEYFAREQALHETKYLAGANPRQQSGFGRDARDWERFRRPVVAPIDRDGSFLEIGCANGLLMESVVAWARESGHRLEPFGLDISEKLAELARRRLPHWRDRVFIGNALFWDPPVLFDFVRTELVYVPPSRRREFAERLLERFVAPGGLLWSRTCEEWTRPRRPPGARNPRSPASACRAGPRRPSHRRGPNRSCSPSPSSFREQSLTR